MPQWRPPRLSYWLFTSCVLYINGLATAFNDSAFLSVYDVKIKSKLLVFRAVSTTINDQGCQHVTGVFESIRMPLSKSAG